MISAVHVTWSDFKKEEFTDMSKKLNLTTKKHNIKMLFDQNRFKVSIETYFKERG